MEDEELQIQVGLLATRTGVELRTINAIIVGLRESTGLTGELGVPGAETFVDAIARLDALIAASTDIDDAVTSSQTAWSSYKTDLEIATAIADLVGTAPDLLNTLEEIATLVTNETGVLDAVEALVATNATAIADETAARIAADSTHSTDIATNATAIADETAARIAADSTHSADIATNAADIATNAAGIATNVTGIATARADFEAADAALTGAIASISGRYAGSSSTFAALPVLHTDGSSVVNGDEATLTSLDGANLPGRYRRVSNAWVLEEWVGSKGIIDVTQHGVVATPETVDVTDSANSAEFIDNSTALIAIRDKLTEINRDRHWTLVFPPTDGCYQYDNNRWIYGLTNVSIIATGARIQCTYDIQHTVGDTPWFPRNDSIFTAKGDHQYRGGTTFYGGDEISTTSIGDRSITLLDAGDAAKYSAGYRILIHSMCQQVGGYSPNLRYFEWAKIKSISGSTLTLCDPIVYEHRDDLVDVLYSDSRAFGATEDVLFGKARIAQLTNRPTWSGNPYYYHEKVKVSGGRWILNPFFPDGAQGFTISAQNLSLNDMTIEGENGRLFVRETESFTARNMIVEGTVEMDKVVDRTSIYDSSVLGPEGDGYHSIKSGTSVNIISLKRVACAFRINVVAQKHLRITDCYASILAKNSQGVAFSSTSERFGAITLYNGVYGGTAVTVDGGLYNNNPGALPIGHGVLDTDAIDGYASFVPDSVSGSSLFVDRTNADLITEVLPNVVETLRTGFIVRNMSGDIVGTVSRIVDSGDGRHEIVLDVTGTMFIASERVQYKHVQRGFYNGRLLWDESLATGAP